MANSEPHDPKTILATILGERADLAGAATAIFDYAQYLLDDDERLTKTGALDGAGRDLLRTRTLETLGGPAADVEEEEAEDDEEVVDGELLDTDPFLDTA
ncbi:MAG: hypothetical protein H0T79_06670, partial [Deltaproteobacteria bacterium]|nr:hypothetical protein [Deltaproteobacteria bacterium]